MTTGQMESFIFVGEEFLAHYGVKGMRWGVRRERGPSVYEPPKGVHISRDGSMRIEKGANLQRLVRSNGSSLPMKDLTYASLNDYDNARYIKVIGGKGFLGGGRDQILSMVATKEIKAPSYDEATRMTSELYASNPKFRKSMTNMLGEEISGRELKKIAKDPTGETAKAWYESANQALTFSEEFSPGVSVGQRMLREKVESEGYNALRDENDVGGRVAKAPIIIFNPQSSLKVTTVTNITDELRRANKEKLKQYKRMGKDWADREMYND